MKNEPFRIVVAGGGSLADDADPSDVVIDGTGLIFFRPDIEENEIAFANGDGVSGAGFVVRVAAVGIDGDDRYTVNVSSVRSSSRTFAFRSDLSRCRNIKLMILDHADDISSDELVKVF